MSALPSDLPRSADGVAPSPASDTPPTLASTALVKRVGQTEALRGVDVAVSRGEILAVMGPSGSGKSTLLLCLAGILRPDGGEVRLDGQRIDDLDEAARSRLRRTVFGFVFQFGQLVPELPAIENAALPLLLNGWPRSDAMSAAAAWLDRLGLGGLEARRPGELSGGQAQRVAIARALVIGPRIIFADEPTGALDSLAGEQVMEHLTEAARTEGVAVVLVTHEPRVAAYADRQIVVRDGRIGGAEAQPAAPAPAPVGAPPEPPAEAPTER
jgi:putative ABC transport system ATP-binding protein